MVEYVRLTDFLMNYWEELKGDKPLPLEDQVNPEYIDNAGMWEQCFFVIIPDDRKFKYSYLGKNLIEAYGKDLNKQEVDLLISPSTHQVIKKFNKIIDEKQPLADDGEFRNSDNLLIKYRQLILPFGDENEPDNVKFLFGGMNWKVS